MIHPRHVVFTTTNTKATHSFSSTFLAEIGLFGDNCGFHGFSLINFRREYRNRNAINEYLEHYNLFPPAMLPNEFEKLFRREFMALQYMTDMEKNLMVLAQTKLVAEYVDSFRNDVRLAGNGLDETRSWHPNRKQPKYWGPIRG